MAKPELGIKRTCPECAARFYDLCKMPCECPKCEHSFEPEILLKSKKRIIESDKPKEAPKAKAEPETEGDDDEESSGVEEVSAEGMSKMPAAVDENGLAVSPDDEADEVVIDGAVDADDETDEDDNSTLVNFDDDDDDVAAIIDTDIDKLKDDL